MLAWQDVCLIWTGSCDRDGYGQLPRRVDGFYKAHRYAYFKARGVDPGDLKVCHHCDNPPCCLIDHLFLGTDADNVKDKMAKGRNVSPFPLPGETNPIATLTNEQAAIVRQRHAAAIGNKRDRRGSDGTITALAREFGVTHGVIWNIVRGKTYQVISQAD